VPSIGVLPCADMSPGKDQEYFADGVAEEILNALTHVQGLRVVGRTSSFSFKGKKDDLRSIGRKLGAATLLEGSCRREGSRIRITAQLVKAADDGYYIWSETYDREAGGVFQAQDEIARAVVAALLPRLVGKPKAAPAPATSPEAYNQYLLGRDLLRSEEIDHVKRALAVFEEAISLDAGLAMAWAEVAHAILFLEGVAGEGTSLEQRQRALDASERAIALAPDLPDGYVARGWIRSSFMSDWEGARVDLERARALGPGDASAIGIHGRILVQLGRLREAVALLERAAEIDPLSARAWTLLGRALVHAGDHERGRAALARTLELFPRGGLARFHLFVDLATVNRPDLALAAAESEELAWVRLTGVSIAQHDLGHAQESQAALEALVKGNGADAAYQVAEVHAWRGETDQAFEWLERARLQADTGISLIKTDPLLRKIRGDPRFAVMLRKLKLPVD
jgi:TolB-like protein